MDNDPQKQVARDESFRDRIATVDEDGHRIWVYPRQPKGRYYRARTWVSYVLIAVLFLLPFVKVGGQPLVLLNFLERKFIIFGVSFWPQDFHLFALSLITFIVFIILFTVVFGRVFCGWICPQTIFLEMLFRKIEYAIEGDAPKQRLLDASPWTLDKITKKTIKHVVFYMLSFLIGNIFLSYIISMDALIKIVTEPIQDHVAGFIAIIIFSFVFYGVFSYFREQVCVIVCPYGRLQGVLLDHNSIVVSYDTKRGEPRGTSKAGDCIDCHLCVDVCPTGIDIRNGTQLECVNCTACIDACDTVMAKIKRPLGLIRYASHEGITSGVHRYITPRVIGYSLVLMVLATLIVVLLANRSSIESTILRTPGTLYQELPQGRIQNIYNIQIVNKSGVDKSLDFKIHNRNDAAFKVIGNLPLTLAADKVTETVLFVSLPKEALMVADEPLVVGVYVDGKLVEEVHTSFRAPDAEIEQSEK